MSNIPILFILFRRLCIVSRGIAKVFGALHNLLGLYIICRVLSAALHSLHVGALYHVVSPSQSTHPTPHSPGPTAHWPKAVRAVPPFPKGIYLSLYIYTHIYIHREREKKCICAVHSCHRNVFLFKQAESFCACCRTS